MTDNSTPIIMTESPASWNTRYLDPSGFECQLTLRAANGAELLRKAGAALAELIKQGCTPVAFKPSNGHTNGVQPDMMVCEIHNATMAKHEKDGQVWWSHKLADGSYCKGKK